MSMRSVSGSSANEPAGPRGGHAHSKSHSGLNSYSAGASSASGLGSNGPLTAGGQPMDRSSSSGAALSPGNLAMGTNSGLNGSQQAKFRASIDAARSLYAPGSSTSGLTPTGSPNLGAHGRGGSKRPSSEMLPGMAAQGINISENDAIDKWFEDLHHYEATLEEMAAASLDQSFKEELGAIEQWFRVLSEAERTAALYSLLQSSSQVQIRFFITVLQQMSRNDPMTALLSPANPQQSSMEAQMEAKLAGLNLKSTAPSPVPRNFARQSMGATPTSDMSGFLSPNSALLNAGASLPASRSMPLDEANNSAADRLAHQRARLNANAANRISAPGSLLSAHVGDLKSPLWSQANNDSVAERMGRSPSPDNRSNQSRSRPASMLSDYSNGGNGAAGNALNNSNPAGLSINSNIPTMADAQLSPLLTNQNWAAMMQTPLSSSFGNLDASGNNAYTASQSQSRTSDWATSSSGANNIVLDDAKKFRRDARGGSDAGLDNGQQSFNNANNPAQAAAMAAQQNWRNVNGLMNSPSVPQSATLGSPDLSQLANIQAAMQGMASPQLAIANLVAAQQQLQQQMQLQQSLQNLGLGYNGMSPLGLMGMQSPNLNQHQQMSPMLGGLGVGMFPGGPHSSKDRRSPRPSDRSQFGGDKSKSAAPVVPGTGSNPDEPVDLRILSDVAGWLRSLRLHKYTPNFETSNWREMVLMDEAALEAKGVAALGARRKLLKVFENVRNDQKIPHPPGLEPRAASPAPSGVSGTGTNAGDL